ncbi:MAG: hypothetical protein M0Z51_13680 [Propionibacterium sp.]|nr:hypothetical protein [Propionibacterium sp.]
MNEAFCTTMLGEALGDEEPVEEGLGLDDVGAGDKADVAVAAAEVIEEVGDGLWTADGAGYR